MNIAITESMADVATQIEPMPTQNAVGYIDISNDFSLNNQLPPLKNNECNQLNIALKSIIAHAPKITKSATTINPDQKIDRPIALLPQKTKSKMQNNNAPKEQIPNAILTFAKKLLTSSK